MNVKYETIDQYLARGGKIQYIPEKVSFYNSNASFQWTSNDAKSLIRGGLEGVARYARNKKFYNYFTAKENQYQ